MIEQKGNLLDHLKDNNTVFITTNGFVKSNGCNVMGRGCALSFVQRFPGLDYKVGQYIKNNGNTLQIVLIGNKYQVGIFPVKLDYVTYNGTNIVSHMKHNCYIGKNYPGWMSIADINIIRESAILLASMASNDQEHMFYIPRPGCGAGELSWNTVGAMLHQILPNNVVSLTL